MKPGRRPQLERPMPRIIYRVVTGDPPPLDDFLSAQALGEPPPLNPDQARLHDGISVYATERQARRKAQAYPWIGDYLAVLELSDDAPVRVERTLPRSRGHHTLWGDPEYLRDRVVSIVPV
jgi:hypothetical protein